MGTHFWITSIGAAAAATLLLFMLGLRGRRIDNHPLCRRCGFDLFGLPPDGRRCSECGADLERSRGVRRGRRQSFRWIVWPAASALVLQLGFLGIAAYVVARHLDLNARKPTWWLIDETNLKSTRAAALAELSKRLEAGSLSSQQADALVDRALAMQGNVSVPWDLSWEEFLIRALRIGKLSDTQWVRYVRQSITFKLDVRPVVARGMPLPMQLSWADGGRGFALGAFPMDGEIIAEGRVLRFSLADGPQRDNSIPLFASGITSFESRNDAETVRVRLSTHSEGAILTNIIGRQPTPVTFELEGKYRVCSPDPQPIARQTAADLEPVQRQSIQISVLPIAHSTNSKTDAALVITVTKPRVGLASDIVLSHYGTIGYMVAPVGRTSSSLLLLPPRAFRGTMLHVVLKPDDRLAVQSVVLMPEVWYRPIEMDVPVPVSSGISLQPAPTPPTIDMRLSK